MSLLENPLIINELRKNYESRIYQTYRIHMTIVDYLKLLNKLYKPVDNHQSTMNF